MSLTTFLPGGFVVDYRLTPYPGLIVAAYTIIWIFNTSTLFSAFDVSRPTFKTLIDRVANLAFISLITL